MGAARFTDLRRFEQLDSTNTTLGELAAAGAPEGVVVVAAYQRAGRGRMDRRWVAPAGSSLLCSILLRPVLEPTSLQLITVMVALSARAGLLGLSRKAPEVKWPNDLLYEGRKVGGILAEAHPSAPGGRPGSCAVVAGLGINLSFEGPEGVGGTSVRAGTGVELSADSVLAGLLAELDRRYDDLEQPGGSERLIDEYRSTLATLGRAVVVQTPTGDVEGRAETVDDRGALVVVNDDGRHTFTVGDVVHLRPGAGGH